MKFQAPLKIAEEGLHPSDQSSGVVIPDIRRCTQIYENCDTYTRAAIFISPVLGSAF
jgi:hypothetical protein